MARKFGVAVDLQKNELQNARVQNLAGAPSAPVAGQIYYDTTASVLYWYDGTVWVPAKDADGGSSPTGAAGGVLSGTYPNPGFAVDPYARVNHTGTQAAATISDFNTAVRTNTLAQLAAPTGPVSLNGQRITSVGDPTAATDAANKGYVDNAVAGLSWKDSARVRASTNVNLAAPGAAIDGVTMVAGDRVLLTGQTAPNQNGIRVWNGAATTMQLALDADTGADVLGMAVFVEEGTSADTAWVLTTNAPITINVTSLAFAQFTGAAAFTAGDGLSQTGNVINVGAGTGIVVAADTVSVDTAVVSRKYAANIGDGAALAFVLTHGLATRDVQVQVYPNAAPYDTVETDVERTTTGTVTLRFSVAPALNAYRAVVMG
jgi:hypothetical protein